MEENDRFYDFTNTDGGDSPNDAGTRSDGSDNVTGSAYGDSSVSDQGYSRGNTFEPGSDAGAGYGSSSNNYGGNFEPGSNSGTNYGGYGSNPTGSGSNPGGYGGGNNLGGGFEPDKKNNRKKRSTGRIVAAVAGIALIGAVVCGAAWGLDGIGRKSGNTRGIAAATQAETQADTQAEEPQTQADHPGRGETAAVLPATEPAAQPSGETAAVYSDIGSNAVKSAGTAQAGSDDVVSVVETSMPSIVSITSMTAYQNYSQFGYNPFGQYGFGGWGSGSGSGSGSNGGGDTQLTPTSAGSGVIIGDNGSEVLIVTNNHVVEDSDALVVSFCDEETADGVIKGTSPDNDLAVVAVDISDLSQKTLDTIRVIELGDSNSLKLGQKVIAIGNALGLGQSVTTGILRATSRNLTTTEGQMLNLLQTDAAINPGNSGGALLDAYGRLIGINVAKAGVSGSEGVGFAIPISDVRNVINELSQKETKKKVDESLYPYLGVKLQDVTSSVARMYNMPVGLMVYSVEPGAPAEKAGILKNDIIIKFDGEKIETYADLTALLPYYAGGTTVDVTVMRIENNEYVETTIPVTLGLRTDYVNS